jgi:hypothetical protein
MLSVLVNLFYLTALFMKTKSFTKTKRINLRLSEAEKAELFDYAKRLNVPVASLLRLGSLHYARELAKSSGFNAGAA